MGMGKWTVWSDIISWIPLNLIYNEAFNEVLFIGKYTNAPWIFFVELSCVLTHRFFNLTTSGLIYGWGASWAATLSVVMGNKRKEEEGRWGEEGCKLKRTPTVLSLLLLLYVVASIFIDISCKLSQMFDNLDLADSVSLLLFTIDCPHWVIACNDFRSLSIV